jgi:hypothetical protein
MFLFSLRSAYERMCGVSRSLLRGISPIEQQQYLDIVFFNIFQLTILFTINDDHS